MKLAAMALLGLLGSIPSIRPMQGNSPEISRPKSVVKTSHLGTNDVAVTCLNGSIPQAKAVGTVLIVSCGTGQ